MKKKQLMNRDEIKSFVLWMVLDGIECVPKETEESYYKRIEAAGCGSRLEYFDKCIDRMK